MDRCTDQGNAARFVEIHGLNARYCNPMRSWYLWNGKYWALDDTQKIKLLAQETVDQMSRDVAKITDPTEQINVKKWVTKSRQRGRLTNMVAMAEAYLPIKPEELDTDGWLLNVQNGTIDLSTGELLPHSQGHFISKVAQVEFDAHATCPIWDETLNTILAGDQDLMRYVQKVIGYALTGETKEKCFFILHGSGDNGKTLFINAVMAVLGDYAASTAMDTFIVNNPGAPGNDIMRLKGSRLAMASEAEKQFTLAEAKIKRLTGNDKYTARLLYKEPIDFYPEFKIFLLTNQIPKFSVTDVALMNRIHLVPFAVTIPKDQQDKDLLDKLKQEASGILNWAIRGCLLWQAEGLRPPKAVIAALEDYRLDVDVVARFIEECCMLVPAAKVGVNQLHNAYKEWCATYELDALGRKGFTDAVSARGFQKARAAGSVMWSGINITEQG